MSIFLRLSVSLPLPAAQIKRRGFIILLLCLVGIKLVGINNYLVQNAVPGDIKAQSPAHIPELKVVVTAACIISKGNCLKLS